MSAPTFGELFAGIAGFGVGLERAGLRPRWQVEIDPAAVRVLTRHWPDVPRYGDVTAVSGADLAPVDVLTAGFPCQDVSVAGKRAGLAGTRTGLFWQITRIVREMREATDGQCPTFLVLENVPGLLSSNGGRDMAVVLGAMGELGPLDCAWRILDAQYFGVAQRRRRLFVVADFRGERAAQVLFEPESGDGHPAPRRQAGQRIASLLASGAGTSRPAGVASEPDFLVCQTVTPTLSSNGDAHSGLRDDGGLVVAHALTAHRPRLDPNGEDFFVLPFDTTQVTSDKNYSTPRAGDTDHPLAAGMHAPAIAFDWQSGGDVRLNCSETHTSALHAGQTPPVSGPAVRRLTPRECERLQGFPDDWTAGESDSVRYRLLGNAVCCAVSTWLGHRLMEAHRG